MATMVANPLRLTAGAKDQQTAEFTQASSAPMQARFYPYDYNGGCVRASMAWQWC